MAGIHMIGSPPCPPEDLPVDAFLDALACSRKVSARWRHRDFVEGAIATRGSGEEVERVDRELRDESGFEEQLGNVADFLRWAGAGRAAPQGAV